MKIILERSGGLTGIPRSIVLDTTELPASTASEVDQLIVAAELGRRQRSISATAGAADMITYRLTVSGDDRTEIMQFTDPIPDQALQALVTRLQQIDRGQ